MNLLDFLIPKKENDETNITNLNDAVIDKIADKVVEKLSANDEPTEPKEPTEPTESTEPTE